MAIDLAPHSKQGLAIASPLMAGNGAVGYADAWPPGIMPELFGAIVTPSVSWRPRRGQAPPRLAETPGGFVLATGDHNPGLRRILQDHAASWRRLAVPIIVAFASSTPEDWDRLAGSLEDEPAAAGIELQVPEGARSGEVGDWVATTRRASTLPMLVKLPVTRAAEMALACVSAGADALVVGVAPLATHPAIASELLRGKLALALRTGGGNVEGPVAGPVAFPFTLHALRAVVAALGDVHVPLVAAGGITSQAEARCCLAEGAMALQIRSLVWTDPAAAVRLARAL